MTQQSGELVRQIRDCPFEGKKWKKSGRALGERFYLESSLVSRDDLRWSGLATTVSGRARNNPSIIFIFLALASLLPMSN